MLFPSLQKILLNRAALVALGWRNNIWKLFYYSIYYFVNHLLKWKKTKQKKHHCYLCYIEFDNSDFRSHVSQKKKKRSLIAIQSSLSPGGSAAVLHSQPAFCPGLAVWGWGLGALPLWRHPALYSWRSETQPWRVCCCYHPFQHAFGKQQSETRCIVQSP